MNLTVRNAEPADGPLIASFNAAMANETEGKSLDRDLVGQGVDNLLADPSRGRYWVAETAGKVIGQLMVTYEWSDWRNGNVWWIQSVYIHPEWRRQGVFTALYRHVQSLASAEPGVIGLRLYVEESNTRAQRTYETLGMVKPNYLVMEAMFSKEPNDAEY